MELAGLSRRLTHLSHRLPTEHPLPEVLTIFGERIAVLLVGSLAAVVLIVSVLMIFKTPLISLSIATGLFFLIAIRHVFTDATRFGESFSSTPDQKAYDAPRTMMDEPASAPNEVGTWAIAETARLEAEIIILEHHLRSLDEEKASRRLLFSRQLHTWQGLTEEELPPFSIQDDVRRAKLYFLAAVGCTLLEVVLTSWVSIQLGFTPWYGPFVAIFLVFITQGVVSLTLTGPEYRRSETVGRIRRFVLLPSLIPCAVSLMLLLILRVSGGPVTSTPLLVFNLSLWGLSVVLPLMAGSFLALGEELSWSRKAEQEYKSIEKEEFKIDARRQRLIGQVTSWRARLEAGSANATLRLSTRTVT